MHNSTNNIGIMILEGSDLLKHNRDGIKIKKDYNGVMPYSLLLDKLSQVGLKIKSDKTHDIIIINFSYGFTPLEAKAKQQTVSKNIEIISSKLSVKKDLISQRMKQDGNEAKKPYTNQIKHLAQEIKKLKTINKAIDAEIKSMQFSSAQVREILYNDGCSLTFGDQTINYKFWFRSPSKSKIGSVCFINQNLFYAIDDWQRMSIKLPDVNAKLVEMEAYKSLTSSAIEDTIRINPATEMLVVSDLKSYVSEMCCRVYVNEDGQCDAADEMMQIHNTLFDGMCLLDDSFFNGDASIKVLRQHFFKSCGFRTYIQDFYRDYFGDDYETATVTDRYGRQVAVKNIKCITSENSMKWEKFGIDYGYWCNRVHQDNNVFGVCKTDHNSKYGNYQRMSMQMINTLPIDHDEAIELCRDSIDYINELKTNDRVFLNYLEVNKSYFNANAMMTDLYNCNPDFAKSQLYRKFRVQTISKYKDTLRAGKLLTHANNLTVCGNPYTLLLHSIGELDNFIDGDVLDGYTDPTLPVLEDGVSVYTNRFNDGENLAGFRSPHNAPNNIGLFVNCMTDLMDKYFAFNNNVVAVNMIQTSIQDRLNGLDEDADFVYMTNNNICVEAAIRAQQYNTIVNDIPKSNKTYDNSMVDMAAIDNTLARSRYSIGLSSNLAAIALSWYWSNPSPDLYKVVVICSVLAQIAIDSSKRQYVVDLEGETSRLQRLECMQRKVDVGNKSLTAKPYFWIFTKDIKEKQDRTTKNDIETKIELKTKAVQEKKQQTDDLQIHCIIDHICPMDWIQQAIDSIIPSPDREGYVDDAMFVEDIKGKADNRQMERIYKILKGLDDMYRAHFDNDNGFTIDHERWAVEQMIRIDEALQILSKITLSVKTMQMIVKNTLSEDCGYRLRLLNCLYQSQSDLFLSVFVKNMNVVNRPKRLKFKGNYEKAS